MKRCLITGGGGFIGSHLAAYLLQNGLTVYGMVHSDVKHPENLAGDFHILECDILDKSRVEAVLEDVKPEYVFHLAAQTSIPLSWQDAARTFTVNVLGTLNLLEAIRNTGINPIAEITGSSAEYGLTANDATPVKETSGIRPTSPYGLSKMAGSELAGLYWQNYGLHLIRIRPFYIIGPGKVSGACYDFARGIVEVESGQRESINVGNLEAVRDLVDVRDAVRAMWLLADKGKAGDVYNICSGKGTSIKEILDRMISLSRTTVKITTDPKLFRPSDESALIGDGTKLNKLGWKPRITLGKTLGDILEDTRKVLKGGS
jgi:GDP-4-dehydro-6-deoxy-D-mannose reductase